MMRPKIIVSLLSLLTLVSAQAWAAFDVTEIRVSRMDTSALLKDTDLKEFFNKAHCTCETKVEVEVRITGFQTSDTPFQVVAGRNCLDATTKHPLVQSENGNDKGDCIRLFGPVKANTLTGDVLLSSYGSNKTPITARTLMEESCDAVDRQAYEITVYVDTNDDGLWEELSKKVEYTVDTSPPEPPKVDDGAVKAGEGQATITFRSHTDSASDAGTSSKDPNFKGYQVLCAEKSSGAPALASPPAAEYEAAVNICGTGCKGLPSSTASASDAGSSILIPRAGDAGAADAALSDAPVSDLFVGEAGPTDAATATDSGAVTGDSQYCAAYVCSAMQTSPGTITVKGLKNNVGYQFWLMTIDSANNPSSLVLAGSETPKLVEDLWERYKRMGGTATGGCLIGPEEGLFDGWQAGLLGLALVLGLTLIQRRRRRRRADEAKTPEAPGGER